MANNTMTKLATTTVGAGGASSVTFSNIPQNYTDLVVKVSYRDAYAASFLTPNMWFNGDNSSVYSHINLEGAGSGTPGSASQSNATLSYVQNINGASSTSNTFTSGEIYLPNYTSANFKSAGGDVVTENNATQSYADLHAFLYARTNPITSITFQAPSSFVQYSEFTLYGVYAGGTTTPSAPTIASATDLGGGTAQVTISSPAAIPYTVTSNPGGITATGMSPINISGLSPQTSYTFTAQAVAPFGVSAASSASSSVSMYNGMTALATVAVGSGGASTVTFSSIPSGYSHLQIRWTARADNAGGNSTLYMYFNSDTTVNTYPSHGIQGDGSSASAYARTGSSYGNMAAYSALVGGTATANIFGTGVIDILDYANTSKNKTMRMLAGNDKNGSGYVDFVSGAWLNTNAITRIDLGFDGNAVQYSTFVLYGVK